MKYLKVGIMAIIAAGYYPGKVPIQGSFGIALHENISVSDVDASSASIDSEIVLIVAMDYVKVGINQIATIADPILPPGITAITDLTKGETLHFIRASTTNTEVSVIIPK